MLELHLFATKFLHGLVNSRLTWSFALSFLIFLIFINRRASVAYLWRSLHLIEDLVLEKEFFSKIDLPLKILLLALLVTPLICFMPPGVAGPMAKLAYFVIPLLVIHVVVQGFDLIVFGWYFEKHREANLPAVFRVIALSMIYIVVVLILLQHVFGLNVLPLIATSTVMTAVLGLALQDTLKNLFAGLMISLEKRFQQGDWISFRIDANNSTAGEISEIGWRSIRLRTVDDNYVMIPNGTFTSSQVTNFSRPKACYARTLDLPVTVGASTTLVIDILLESMKSVPGIMETPPPDVVPTSVKMDQLVYRLRFWVERYTDADEIAGKVIQSCVARLQNESLMPSMAASANDLAFSGASSITDKALPLVGTGFSKNATSMSPQEERTILDAHVHSSSEPHAETQTSSARTAGGGELYHDRADANESMVSTGVTAAATAASTAATASDSTEPLVIHDASSKEVPTHASAVEAPDAVQADAGG